MDNDWLYRLNGKKSCTDHFKFVGSNICKEQYHLTTLCCYLILEKSSVNSTSANMVPEASACAVSGSVSGPVSAPSCPGLCSRPWMSSFTVYTNNSIYKGIRPVEKGGKGHLKTCGCGLFLSFNTLLVHSISSNCPESDRGLYAIHIMSY